MEEVFPDVDDTDELDPTGEFEAWKLRELMRIKRDKEAFYACVLSFLLGYGADGVGTLQTRKGARGGRGSQGDARGSADEGGS